MSGDTPDTTNTAAMNEFHSGSYYRVTDWLAAHGITFTVTYLHEEEGFRGEKPEKGRPLLWHDVYRAELTRSSLGTPRPGAVVPPRRLEVPKFYQSAACSAAHIKRQRCTCDRTMIHDRHCPMDVRKRETPSAYDVLSSITKSDPGTFADFCADYGYDDDSRRAERTYFAVQEEWTRVRRFFTEKELDELQEIAQ